MFGRGVRELAQEALSRADSAIEKIEKHINECIEANRKTAEWQGGAKEILNHQNVDLDSIKRFLWKVMIAVIATLVTVLGFILWNGLKGLHG